MIHPQENYLYCPVCQDITKQLLGTVLTKHHKRCLRCATLELEAIEKRKSEILRFLSKAENERAILAREIADFSASQNTIRSTEVHYCTCEMQFASLDYLLKHCASSESASHIPGSRPEPRVYEKVSAKAAAFEKTPVEDC